MLKNKLKEGVTLKKLKGFTLVELIVVMAIFSLIMAAVLSLLNPVSDVYSSTANYEHTRAASDNVRLYLQDNIKYADNLKIIYNSDGITKDGNHKNVNDYASDMKSKFDSYEDKYKPQVYVMEIKNFDKDNVENCNGKITIYKDAVGGAVYKEINPSLYSDYAYEFVIPDGFGITNANIDINVYKLVVNGEEKIIPEETDDKFYKLSTNATFSFVNLRNFQSKIPAGTEVKYLTIDGEDVGEENKNLPGVIKVDATKPESNPFQGCNNDGTGNNIYFIYTLPKFINEYK